MTMKFTIPGQGEVEINEPGKRFWNHLKAGTVLGAAAEFTIGGIGLAIGGTAIGLSAGALVATGVAAHYVLDVLDDNNEDDEEVEPIPPSYPKGKVTYGAGGLKDIDTPIQF